MTTAELSREWPRVPADSPENRARLCHGSLAIAVQRDPDLQDTIDWSLAGGKPPLLACLCPSALTPRAFRNAWLRLVTEGEGTVAWAVEWLMAQGTAEQRATLTRADYLACLTSPAGDVRFLGQQFVTETYVLPRRRLLTTRERLTAAATRLGRQMLGQSRAMDPDWSLPPETPDRAGGSPTVGPTRVP